MPDGTQIDKAGYLIALTGFDKKVDRGGHKKVKHQQSFQNSTLARGGQIGVGKNAIMPTLKLDRMKSAMFNPFPEIGGILFDVEKMEVLCTHYRSKEDTMKNIDEKDI